MESDAHYRQLMGMVWILLTALLWSFIGLFGKHCMQMGMEPMQCAFFRALFGAAAFFIHLAVTGRLRIPWRHALGLFCFGIWGIGVYYTATQTTIKLSGAAMDIILQYTAPFWVAIFAAWFFKERITRLKIVSMTVAAVGALFVCLSGSSIPGIFSWLGIFTGLLSGLCYATHYPFTRWSQGQGIPSVVTFAWMLAGGAVALWPICSSQPNLSWSYPPSVWLYLAALGVLCTYLGFICYGRAIERISLVRAVVTSELEPVLSMLWVWLAFGERFTACGWIGSLLIIASVLIIALFQGQDTGV